MMMTLFEYIARHRRGMPALTRGEASIAGIAESLPKGWFKKNRNVLVDSEAMSAARKAKKAHAKAKDLARDSSKPLATAASGDPYQLANGPGFLQSFEWKQLRFRVLRHYGAKCQCCGASPATGAVMQVDHIRSRRRYPELALDFNNLQVLCSKCNHGKANETADFRG